VSATVDGTELIDSGEYFPAITREPGRIARMIRRMPVELWRRPRRNYHRHFLADCVATRPELVSMAYRRLGSASTDLIASATVLTMLSLRTFLAANVEAVVRGAALLG
jgi:hypothetical protein